MRLAFGYEYEFFPLWGTDPLCISLIPEVFEALTASLAMSCATPSSVMCHSVKCPLCIRRQVHRSRRGLDSVDLKNH